MEILWSKWNIYIYLSWHLSVSSPTYTEDRTLPFEFYMFDGVWRHICEVDFLCIDVGGATHMLFSHHIETDKQTRFKFVAVNSALSVKYIKRYTTLTSGFFWCKDQQQLFLYTYCIFWKHERISNKKIEATSDAQKLIQEFLYEFQEKHKKLF